MNQRSKDILSLIIDSNKIPFESLSEIYEVSERTIRNDIEQINYFLQNNNFGYVFIDNKFLKINFTDKEKLQASLNDFNAYDYKFSKEERSLISILIMLGSKDYITVEKLSNKLLTSRATIINDLKIIKKIAKDNNMKVISTRHKGYLIETEEKNARIFLNSVLELENAKVLENIIFDDENIEKSFKLLQKIINDNRNKINFSEQQLAKLMQYLKISVYRNYNNFKILENQNITNNNTVSILKNIIVDEFNYPYLNLNDLIFIVNLFSENNGKKLTSSINRDFIKLQIATMQFIELISEDLKINFNDDYIFYENFSNHIMGIIKNQTSSDRDYLLLHDILEKNHKISEVIESHVDIIEKNISKKLNRVEIGYIVIHIYAALERKKKKGENLKVALLTDERVSQRLLIESKLKNNFSFELELVSPKDTLDKNSYDLILTTIKDFNKEYLKISPIISDEDYILIARKIDEVSRNKKTIEIELSEHTAYKLYDLIAKEIDKSSSENTEQLKKNIKKAILRNVNKSTDNNNYSLSNFLTEDRIELDVEVENWQQAIYKAGQKLIAEKDIESEYLEVVVKNIKENGPYIVISQGFAFPHAQIGSYNLKTAMNLIRLKNEVYFSDEERNVADEIETYPVKYVCLLSTVDKKTHLKAFFDLANMLKNKNFKISLDKCKTPEEIRNLIKEYEYLQSLEG